jgi:hypothetical protein
MACSQPWIAKGSEIVEADFEDSAYGYRPRRGAGDAIKEVHRLFCRGYTDVVDADLSKYFDTPLAQLNNDDAGRLGQSRSFAPSRSHVHLFHREEIQIACCARNASPHPVNRAGLPRGALALLRLLCDHPAHPLGAALLARDGIVGLLKLLKQLGLIGSRQSYRPSCG